MNNRDEFERHWAKWRVWSRGRCLQYCRNWDDAQDLMQDLACSAWRKFDKFDPSKGGFSTWLGWVLKDVWRDWKRKQGRIKTVEWGLFRSDTSPEVGEKNLILFDVAEEAPRERLDVAEIEALALSMMTETQRKVYDMTVVRGMSQAKASEELAITRACVFTHVARMNKHIIDAAEMFGYRRQG